MRLEVLDGPLRGTEVEGIFYRQLGKPPAAGEIVAANTLGLEMDLGTGGVAIVFPRSGAGAPRNENHFVKLPYTPLQFPARLPGQARSLRDVPVVVLPLHSHLAPACCAAAVLRPGVRVSFVWQEGGALPVGLSRLTGVLKEKGLLDKIISTGSCFGGDLEAPNVYAGLLAAAEVSDLALVGIGPGVVGTASGYGHGGMSAAVALNAACALGGEPVLAPRVSAGDLRSRHRGVSHHTRTVLEVTLQSCRVALPELVVGEPATGLPQGLPGTHRYVTVPFGAAGLERRFRLTFESMGRSYQEDSVFFDAAAAAVALALGEASGEAR